MCFIDNFVQGSSLVDGQIFRCCKAAYLGLLSSMLRCATVISQVVSHKVLGAMCHIPVYQVIKDMD